MSPEVMKEMNTNGFPGNVRIRFPDSGERVVTSQRGLTLIDQAVPLISGFISGRSLSYVSENSGLLDYVSRGLNKLADFDFEISDSKLTNSGEYNVFLSLNPMHPKLLYMGSPENDGRAVFSPRRKETWQNALSDLRESGFEVYDNVVNPHNLAIIGDERVKGLVPRDYLSSSLVRT